MNEIEVFLSEVLNLSSGSSLDNALALLGALIFLVISFVNLVPAKKTKEIEKKDLKGEVAETKVAETTEPTPEKVEIEPAPIKLSFSERLKKGLSKTRGDIWNRVGSIIKSGALGEEQLEELEEILYTSDLSPNLVEELIQKIQKMNSEENYKESIKSLLKEKMQSSQDKVNKDLYSFENKTKELKVIMVVGVNGAGKTTTIGKLATKLKRQGAKVVVGACDTFRAAAVEQLEVWCKRADVELIKAPDNANPTGVAFDTVKAAKELEADYCIIDTAGRLHTASNLMDELAKTKKVMSKVVDSAPHETLLVVDAITGQNALRQASEFNAALDLSGLVFTKCDGSSKAGSAVSIVNELQVPIVYIGVGEDVDDLDIFDLDEFLNALVGVA